MKKKRIIIISLLIVLVLSSLIIFNMINYLYISNNNYTNIDKLSKEFMDNYFSEIKELNKENNKENILIVTSKKELKDWYGATKVVKAPNNQYILQYSSEKETKLALKKLKNISHISVSKNEKQELVDDTVLVTNYNSWGVEAMGIDTLLNEMANHELDNVVVSIVDTGLDVELFNQNYPNRLKETYNVLDASTDVTDNVGHGTHIAGTIAELTPASVKILPIKAGNTDSLYTIDTIAGINYATYNKKSDVINMSFGGYIYDEAQYQAIKATEQENIISVCASGNDNTSNQFYPASFDNTISIAAANSNIQKASFSNYGDTIMFSTPGENISSINGVKSGTSMATPHAVGAVALLKSMNNNLSYNDVITLLRRYSNDIGDIGWDEYYGYGFIDFSDATLCDGTSSCDEYNVFKKSNHDDLDETIASYEIIPVLSEYNYGTINNILNSKIRITFLNNKGKEYTLYDISKLEISNYDPYTTEKQTVNISFTIPIGIPIITTFEVTNPSSYESVWEYNVVEDNKIEITGYKETSTSITSLYIPEKIDNYDVVAIANGKNDNSVFSSSWNSLKEVKKLYLPSTLTKIGKNAFYNLDNNHLNYVKSDAESLHIEDQAFRSSKYLVKIDANISYIGDYAFAYNYALLNIGFSTSLTHIGYEAFYSSFAIDGDVTITIPESVTEFDESVFENSYVKKVIFLNSLDNKLPDNTFKNSRVEEVVLPPGLTEIGSHAFYQDQYLKPFTIPSSVTKIGQEAFCGSFAGGSFTIPSTVTNMGSNFLKSTGLKEIIINANMDTIASESFDNSSNLEKIVLPNTITSIGSFAFSKCPKLKEIKLPLNLQTIDNNAFSESFDEATLILPNTIQSIGYSAFLKSGLKEIIIQSNIDRIAYSMFDKSNKLEKVVLPNTIKTIEENAFLECSKLKEINIPSSVTSIGRNAFNQTGLKEINIQGNIDTISNDMFYGSKELETVSLPNTVTTIKEGAFKGCSKLKEINIPENLTTIERNSFFGALDDVSLVLPETVTNIGINAFQNSGLKEIIIKGSINSILDQTFSECTSLEKVVLRGAITSIENSAFYNSTNLNEIYLNKEIISIDNTAFEAISENPTFYVYANSYSKEYVSDNNYNYIQIDPDEIYVRNLRDKYYAFDEIEDIYLELVYNEKETRTEIIDNNISIKYQDNSNSLRYGQTSFEVSAHNSQDYEIKTEVPIEVFKLTPNYTIPNNINGNIEQRLSEIDLPEGFEWMDGSTIINEAGNITYKARYIPEDTNNYEIVDNIDITVSVSNIVLYTVTFNSNYGDNNTSTQKIEKEISTKLKKNNFTREGFNFIGWNTEPDGSGTPYEDEANVTLGNNLTLYAQWKEKDPYTIKEYTYDSENDYITNIDIYTTAEEVFNNVEVLDGYIVEVNCKRIRNNEVVYTGGKTKIIKNKVLFKELTNVVTGDTNGDGEMNYLDYVKVYNHIQKTKNPGSNKKLLENEYLIAADMDKNSTITYLDYVKIYNKIIELKG